MFERLIGLAVACLVGCASVPTVRFENAPIVWQVDDRRDVPVQPSERIYYKSARNFDHTYGNALLDTMAAEPPRRALNINALDEVPDSTWFTNRVGRRELGVDEIRVGPNVSGDPQTFLPWTILKGKATGVMPGFLVEDARGEKYLIKFGRGGTSEMESAADVIVQRLFWAVGYNVPEDRVASVRAEDLRLGPDATVSHPSGKKMRMTRKHVERVLATVDREPDGRLRVLTSRLLPGDPIGGHPERGLRRDDPNDVVPHEERRELRAQYVFFAWVSHTDVKESNTLDIWREDPADETRHYVEHYLVDFGQALGVMGVNPPDPSNGFAYNFDPPLAAMSLLTLGIVPRPGEDSRGPGLPGVGRFESKHYNPGRFRTHRRHRPLDRLDEHDALWASKILMRLTPEHIMAAVEAGELSDPRAEEFLLHTLVARQRKTAHYWLSRVNPLDEPGLQETAPGRLRACMTDLLIHHELADVWRSTRYEVVVYTDAGRRIGKPQRRVAREDGRVCFDDLPVGGGPEDYTMVGFATERADEKLDRVWIHAARDPDRGTMRVIGIWRE